MSGANAKSEKANNSWWSRFAFERTSMQCNQVASESVHGARLAAAELAGCAACEEESKLCECREVNRLAGYETEQHHSKPNSSFAHSVINMIGMLIGLGQLSTAYALENGGWATAFLLVGLGLVCAYTAHVLGRCLDADPSGGAKSYQDLGAVAFGSKGRNLAAAFIYLEIFLALVAYTISLNDNLPLLFPSAHLHLHLPWLRHVSPRQLLTVAAVMLAVPSLWLRDLSSISFLSFAGILTSLLIFATVGWTAAFGGIRADHVIPALRVGKIPAISGLYAFSYAGHIVFPNIYTAMKDPSKFTKVSITSFTIVTILYTALAFTGAKLFGPGVSSQITLGMPPHLAATKIALWATVLTPMTKYALEFAPFAIQLERSLPSSMSSRTRMLVRGAVGSALLILILLLALSVPYFEYVLSLTGSLVSVGISLVFPCVFYLKICRGSVSRSIVVLNAAIIIVGIVLGVVGTISSSKSLILSIQKGCSS
ncbi:vacuolar amino acid transporter 1 [Ananas comosus]|uniref:Vacuolar amino acid transporter 1 n=1 Tax=Ananas comosus TaxID=4615 RepID=A0A6P5GE44_ANACO|nr:vacuolar amino acid transporter 1 [Ananas comosus]